MDTAIIPLRNLIGVCSPPPSFIYGQENFIFLPYLDIAVIYILQFTVIIVVISHLEHTLLSLNILDLNLDPINLLSSIFSSPPMTFSQFPLRSLMIVSVL